MLTTHEKIRIPNINLEGKNLEIEINYRGKKDFVYDEIEGMEIPVKDEKRILKFKIGEEEAEIRYKDIWSVVFMCGDSVNQTVLAPVKWSEQRYINQRLKIKADRDIKRGETIVVKHTVKLPDKYFKEVHHKGFVIPQITADGLDLLSGNV